MCVCLQWKWQGESDLWEEVGMLSWKCICRQLCCDWPLTGLSSQLSVCAAVPDLLPRPAVSSHRWGDAERTFLTSSWKGNWGYCIWQPVPPTPAPSPTQHCFSIFSLGTVEFYVKKLCGDRVLTWWLTHNLHLGSTLQLADQGQVILALMTWVSSFKWDNWKSL